jgi:hypothetical protein
MQRTHPALLAHRAAAAVAAHEKARADALSAGPDGDFIARIVRSLEAFDTLAAPDLDSDRGVRMAAVEAGIQDLRARRSNMNRRTVVTIAFAAAT